MTITPEKYVRKPLIVLGVQVTKENFMELALWVQGSVFNPDGTQHGEINPEKQYILVRVHNPKSPKQSKAFLGDWILYSDRGYKVYSPKAFTNTFDPMDAIEFQPEQVEDEGALARFDRQKEEEKEEEYEIHYEAKKVNPSDALHNELDDDGGIRGQLIENKKKELEETEEERLDRLDRLKGKQPKVGGDGV